MRSSMIRLAMVFGAATLTFSCAEPFGPQEVAGTYALEQVAGDFLPALLFTNESVTIRIYADTLHLNADGRGTMVRVSETQVRTGGAPTGPARSESSFSFAIVQGRIEIAFDCPIEANCAPSPHIVARHTPPGLQVDRSLGERVPQMYGRVAPAP